MPHAPRRFALGLDYGTNSVRALVVDLDDGAELASHVFHYPTGTAGIVTSAKDPNLARQHPADYIEGFLKAAAGAVKSARKAKGFDPARVVGIGIDTTGSTPMPVDAAGTPLALLPKFKDNPDAMAWLWKDHTSHHEADRITEAAKRQADAGGDDYLAKCGGAYSSEWFWSKIWHCKKESPKAFRAAWGWVEQSDFIPAFLTGNTDPMTCSRGICAAGHKGMYHESWGGFPSTEFLAGLDKDLAKYRDRFTARTSTAEQCAGVLTEACAKKSGLIPGIPVAVGAIDAHLGAVGAGIKPGTLVKIMGTSTCDMMVHPMGQPLADIRGVCGIVPGSILPGMYGIEAGQSAVGDIFNWFCKNLVPEQYTAKGEVHANLSRAAEKLRPGESGLLALDWNNGNRSVLTDPLLTGLTVGMTLHTTAPEMYRALIEATAFGALAIINRIEEYSVKVKEVVNCGGIAEKSPLTMQIYADICNRPMKISRSAQSCALGAAIIGAVVGKAFPNVTAAQKKMTGVKATVYRPNRPAVATYRRLFELYRSLHDEFGGKDGALHPVMKKLIEIRSAR